MELKIDGTGVYLDGSKVQCTRVDIDNINQLDGIEAVLHVPVDPIDVHFESYDSLGNKRENG